MSGHTLKSFRPSHVLLVILIPIITYSCEAAKALDSSKCLNLRGNSVQCNYDEYCSSSMLDRGCRSCDVIYEAYCHNITKIRDDFPTCEAYCERRLGEERLTKVNDTLQDEKSKNQQLLESKEHLNDEKEMLVWITIGVPVCLVVVILILLHFVTHYRTLANKYCAQLADMGSTASANGNKHCPLRRLIEWFKGKQLRAPVPAESDQEAALLRSLTLRSAPDSTSTDPHRGSPDANDTSNNDDNAVNDFQRQGCNNSHLPSATVPV